MRISIKNLDQFIAEFNNTQSPRNRLNKEILEVFFQEYGCPCENELHPETVTRSIMRWRNRTPDKILKAIILSNRKKRTYFVYQIELLREKTNFDTTAPTYDLSQKDFLNPYIKLFQVNNGISLFARRTKKKIVINPLDLVYDFVNLALRMSTVTTANTPFFQEEVMLFITHYDYLLSMDTVLFPLPEENYLTNFKKILNNIADIFVLRERFPEFPSLKNFSNFDDTNLSLDKFSYLLAEANKRKLDPYRKVKQPVNLIEKYDGVLPIILSHVIFDKWKKCSYKKCQQWFIYNGYSNKVDNNNALDCCCPRHQDNFRKTRNKCENFQKNSD